LAVTTRAALHHLVDELPECLWSEAERYLRGLTTDDPVLRALLLAPPEDEELDPEEIRALETARAKRARGEAVYVSDEDVARELGG
jgi:hypothetical protein